MRHPNIVAVMGFSAPPDPAIVYEYIEGGSLHDRFHDVVCILLYQFVVFMLPLAKRRAWLFRLGEESVHFGRHVPWAPVSAHCRTTYCASRHQIVG